MRSRERKLATMALYYQKNREAIKARMRAYREANSSRVNQLSRERTKRPEVRARRNHQSRKRYATDIQFRIFTLVRTRLNQVARKTKSERWDELRTVKLLGCSTIEFKLHIEAQFRRGMTWENFGRVWHLDHKVPCAIFDFTDPIQIKRCFNYLNYQPLWASENMSKRHHLKQPEQVVLGL